MWSTSTAPKDGNAAQTDLIQRIAADSGLKVQTGGGIRSENQIHAYLNGGIARVVIGSLALTNPGLVATWLDRFGATAFVLAFDVKPDDRGWHVTTHGWQKDSGKTLFEVIDEYAPPICAICSAPTSRATGCWAGRTSRSIGKFTRSIRGSRCRRRAASPASMTCAR